MAHIIDWDLLRSTARTVAHNGYAPYSHLHVGAAALLEDGRVLTGVNVENVSYGLTFCAEVTLVGTMHLSGGGRIVALAAAASDGRWLTPCGRCRQVLMEHGGPEMLIDSLAGPRTLGELLPESFTEADLPRSQGN
jgi:cytidine deaminase